MKFDCVVIIDCWSVFQMDEVAKQEDWDADTKKLAVARLKAYYKQFKLTLEGYEFDSVLHAVYANEYNSILYTHESKPEYQQTLPAERWMYRSNPLKSENLGNGKVNSLTVDVANISDIESLTKSTNKNILVCGRSWLACLHFREVGIEYLMNAGYNVFVDSRLVHCEHTRQRTVPVGIDYDDLLNDDIIWSTHRTDVGTPQHKLHHHLYRAVAIHADRAHHNPEPAAATNPSLYIH